MLLVAIYSVGNKGRRNVLRRLKLCNNLGTTTRDFTDYLLNWLDYALIYIAMGKINIVAGLMHSSISPWGGLKHREHSLMQANLLCRKPCHAGGPTLL